jgi:hypothetical protein
MAGGILSPFISSVHISPVPSCLHNILRPNRIDYDLSNAWEGEQLIHSAAHPHMHPTALISLSFCSSSSLAPSNLPSGA